MSDRKIIVLVLLWWLTATLATHLNYMTVRNNSRPPAPATCTGVEAC